MKLIIEPINKDINKYVNIVDGIILGLKDYSVLNQVEFTKEEIKQIKAENENLELFIKIDKNIFNSDIEELKETLKFLDDVKIDGIFFYDISLLQLKKELNLNINLIWSQTHMVTNYRTCDYYYENGVNYALLSKEITLDEIIEISNKSKISTMVEVISLPSVSYSRRKLVTNYNHDIGLDNSNHSLEIIEKVTNSKYKVLEEKNGTGFILDKPLNGTSIIKELYKNNVSYIIFREYGINDFIELVKDTKEYIKNECNDEKYIDKYKKLGDYTGFFHQKTIYKVKK